MMPVPPECREFIDRLMIDIKTLLPSLARRYIPHVTRIALYQGMTWDPTFKSLPNYAVARAFGLRKSPYTFMPLELKSFGSFLRFCHSQWDLASPLVLWPKFTRYPFDEKNNFWSYVLSDQCELTFAPKLPHTQDSGAAFYRPGRLASVCEGRAKRRVFAMGNFIKQRLLKPVHDWLMKVLSGIPMDGTYNQMRPVLRLKGFHSFDSCDLTAATDRMPLELSHQVMRSFFSIQFASSAVQALLALNVYEVGFLKARRDAGPLDMRPCVAFRAGQTLGYLSSWPLFALTHHVLVWVAAEQVHPGVMFDRYALLGDDIVIADRAVASKYREILSGIGVKISPLLV